jgi:hypothetical protein
MKSEDLERIVEFQTKIASQQEGVKYTVDTDIETQVKIEYLIETFGDYDVDTELSVSGMKYADLADPEKYNIIYSILSSRL